jgi:hypothetical protein
MAVLKSWLFCHQCSYFGKLRKRGVVLLDLHRACTALPWDRKVVRMCCPRRFLQSRKTWSPCGGLFSIRFYFPLTLHSLGALPAGAEIRSILVHA